jgi:Tfp pilus assembly protein PilO
MKEFKKKLLVNLGINFGITVVICVLMVIVFSDLKSVGKSIETAAKAITDRTQAMSSLNLLKKDADKAGELANQLRNALPSRESLFSFSEEINRLARDMGLTSNFIFGNEIPSGTPSSPSKAEFMITVSGRYEQVLSFMNAFESSRYFTRVKNLEFLSQGINTTAYQAILSGEVFFGN